MLVGNLTRDPELRYTPSGRPVCAFGLATNRRWKNETGEMQEETEFHNVVVWGKLGEIVSQILKKGTKAFVEGRLRTHTWEGQDGIKRQRTEVVMENFIPLSPKGPKEIEEIVEAVPASSEITPEAEIAEKKGKKTNKSAGTTPEDNEEIDLDEIPF